MHFTSRQLRQQLLLLCLGIACLYFIWPFWVFPILALSLAIVGLAWTGFRETLMRGFLRLMQWIGRIQSVLLLGIIYFVVLWPISLVYRLFKKREVRSGTNLQTRNHVYQAVDLEKMW